MSEIRLFPNAVDLASLYRTIYSGLLWGAGPFQPYAPLDEKHKIGPGRIGCVNSVIHEYSHSRTNIVIHELDP
jgi:hypothetical protein